MGFEVLLGCRTTVWTRSRLTFGGGLQGESFPFAGSDAEIWVTFHSWKMIFGCLLPLGFSGDSEWHKSDQTRLE